MKKILAIVLVLTMVLSLCGCDSADYKKATELLDNGEYAAAREIFVALGDYEDSAEMVKECDYQQAKEYLDTDPKAARELFVDLGDYRDSKTLVKAAAWEMLMAYVEEQGGLTNKSSDNSKATAIQVHEGKLVLLYATKFSGPINMDLSIGAEIDPADGRAIITGTDNTSSYAAHYEASASMDWDISTYANGDKLEWTTFEVSGTTAQGTAYTQELTMLNLFATSAMKECTAHLAQVLTDSGLGLTMADLGFDAY